MIRKWGVSSPKMTQSSPVAAAVEMREIKQRLQEDGLDPACSDHERIMHLWQLYIKSEASHKASLEGMEEMRRQQTEEMREVENYVEHIRSLTNERESLTAEFEAENEALKGEIERLTREVQELDNRDEIFEMLVQQGLEDIAMGTISEQIAYLLVERARLMDELEAEQAKGNVDTPEGAMTAQQVYSVLEQERQDYEEELQQQRDALHDVKRRLQETHEEEVAALVADNRKLQDMLDSQSTSKSSSRDTVEMVARGSTSANVSVASASGSSTELTARVQGLEADNSTLQENLKTLSAELQDAQGQIATFKDLALTNERKSDHLQSLIGRLKEEKEELRERVLLAEDRLTENDNRNEKSVFAEMEQEAQTNVKMQVDSLQSEKKSLSDELSSAKADLGGLKEKLKNLDENEDRVEIEETKAKIRKLEQQIQDIEGNLGRVQTELWSKQNEYKKMKMGSTSLSFDSDSVITRLEQQLKESNSRLEEISAEKRNTENELQGLTAEKGTLIAKIATFEARTKELERKGNEYEEEISRLKKTADRQQMDSSALNDQMQEKDDILEQTILKLQTAEQEKEAGDRLVTNYKDDIENLEKQIRGLQEKVEEKEVMIRQMSTDAKADKTDAMKLESMQTEASSSSNTHQMEVASLNNQLEQLQSENKQLKTKLYEDEEEILQLKRDGVQLKGSQSKLQVQVKELEGKVADGEQVRAGLEDELLKCRSQIRELKNEVETLDMDNNQLSDQLDRRTTALTDLETQMKSFSSNQDVRSQNLQKRAEEAEEKLHKLEDEMLEKTSQVTRAEKKAKDLEDVKLEMQNKEEELTRLRSQLQLEKARGSQDKDNETALTQEVEKLHAREKDLQRRNKELQHMLLEVQTKLEVMRESAKTTANQGEAPSSSGEQVVQLKQEVEALQMQLAQINNLYDSQINKYTDRKLRTKNKLHKAREQFSQERMKYTGEIERLQNELAIVKSTLLREQEWKTQVEENYRKMLLEKRDLMSQISEQEESIRDHSRNVSVLQVRSKYLEDENNNLQVRVDSLTKQKHHLDKLLRDMQNDKHRQELDQTINSDFSAFSPRPNGKERMNASLIDDQNHLV